MLVTNSVRQRSGRRAPTKHPGHEGDDGCVAVYQLLTSMSTTGPAPGTNPYKSVHPPSWNTWRTSSAPSSDQPIAPARLVALDSTSNGTASSRPPPPKPTSAATPCRPRPHAGAGGRGVRSVTGADPDPREHGGDLGRPQRLERGEQQHVLLEAVGPRATSDELVLERCWVERHRPTRKRLEVLERDRGRMAAVTLRATPRAPRDALEVRTRSASGATRRLYSSGPRRSRVRTRSIPCAREQHIALQDFPASYASVKSAPCAALSRTGHHLCRADERDATCQQRSCDRSGDVDPVRGEIRSTRSGPTCGRGHRAPEIGLPTARRARCTHRHRRHRRCRCSRLPTRSPRTTSRALW